MLLTSARSAVPASSPCAYDEFITASLGTTLMLKAAGFVLDQHARILNVDESELALRIGSSWWARFLPGATWQPPIDVKLRFHTPGELPLHAPRIPQSVVSVAIKPASKYVNDDEFERSSRRLLWQLRYHFMANA